MRAFVNTRAVGVVGACGLVAVAVMLLLGGLTLAEAARRAGVLLAGVLVLEHAVLPLARLLVGEPAGSGQDDSDQATPAQPRGCAAAARPRPRRPGGAPACPLACEHPLVVRRQAGPAGRRPVPVVPAAAVTVAVTLLAGCTGGGGPGPPVGPGDDVAELRVEAPPPRPGDVLAWTTPPLGASPEAVRDGLLAAYGIGFRTEPAGVRPGERWSATTGSAVRRDDLVRSMALLVDTDGRLRELTCLVAGPVIPDEDMLPRCVELAGLPAATVAWTAERARLPGGADAVGERVAAGAVVRVTTSGGGDRRVQSVQVRGDGPP